MLIYNSDPTHLLVLAHRLHLILMPFIIPGWYRIVPDLHVMVALMAKTTGRYSQFSITACCVMVILMIVLVMVVVLMRVSAIGRLKERKCAYE